MLHTLTMPTLELWADLDRVLDVSSVEVHREHFPDPTIVIMKDCGHSPMAERPTEAAEIYVDFLGDEPATRSLGGETQRRD